MTDTAPTTKPKYDPAKTYWLSPVPAGCQITGDSFDGVMYDAKTPHGWALISQACFEWLGCRTGTGLGQKYELQADGLWLKTEG